MRGQERLKIAWDDAPLAPEIDCPKLLQLDPVTDARLRYLNQIRNFLHGQESPRQHRATPVCRPSMPVQWQGTQSDRIDVHQCPLSVIECI
jgi:hypothetical protein